jgi:hypothetical protein
MEGRGLKRRGKSCVGVGVLAMSTSGDHIGSATVSLWLWSVCDRVLKKDPCTRKFFK